MPFDGTHFRPQPEPPGRRVAVERFWCGVVLVAGIVLLLAPVSAAGLVDLVVYLRGGR
jgi:hypothetical protein